MNIVDCLLKFDIIRVIHDYEVQIRKQLERTQPLIP